MTQLIKRRADHGVSVAIFANDNGTVSYVLQKSWKKKDSEEYESKSISFFGDELLKASELLRLAYLDAITMPNKPAELADVIPF